MMNQDERLAAIMAKVAEYTQITPIDLPSEIARPKSRLKLLDATHYNWEADRFRKLFGMRFSVKIPPFDQLNTIFYPQQNYEAPIFIFFALISKRKVIAHLNVNCPFEDADYFSQWVAPLVESLNQYAPFQSKDRYPEWMKKYRNECTIYGMFPRDRVDDLHACCFDYLSHYLNELMALRPEQNPDRLERIERFHAQFVDDIRTQDKAQGMIAKMIGSEPARRIFYEITT